MSEPFHVRFNIDVPIGEACRRFVNRIENEVRQLVSALEGQEGERSELLDPIMLGVHSALGESHDSYIADSINFTIVWRRLIKNDFHRCLRAVEGLHGQFKKRSLALERLLTTAIESVLSQSEVDLGVSWKDGLFARKGAAALDEGLVNEPLRWLADPKYRTSLYRSKRVFHIFLRGRKTAKGSLML